MRCMDTVRVSPAVLCLLSSLPFGFCGRCCVGAVPGESSCEDRLIGYLTSGIHAPTCALTRLNSLDPIARRARQRRDERLRPEGVQIGRAADHTVEERRFARIWRADDADRREPPS